MKRFIVIILVLGAAATATWYLLSRREEGAGSYRFLAVEQGTIESTVAATGALRATSTVQVGTQVSGQIEEIYVDFNDRVVAGQLIARIDPTLLEQEVRSARNSVQRSRAELEQATREMERARRLHADGAITDVEFDQAQYELTLAETSLESAQIGLDKAERNLKYTEIRAPVTGIVLERNVDVGQTVAASLQAPQLFLIAGDLAKMEILALVDESDIGRIAPGQEVRFTVQAFTERTFSGTVRQVRLQSTTQENVVNYYVAVDVENEGGDLLPGMTATVDFIVERAEGVFKVANSALRFQPTEEMLAEVRARAAGSGRGTAAADTTRGDEGGRRGDRSAGGERGRHADRGRSADRGTLWTVDESGQHAVIRVRTGLTDGQYTAIESPELREGLQVIASVTTSAAGTINNPFDNRSTNSGPRRGPGF